MYSGGVRLQGFERTSPTEAAGVMSKRQGDVRLEKACQDFEAVFLTMLWREMQKSSGIRLGGYDAFAEQAIGSKWAKTGGIGLAKVILKSMSKHL